MSVWKQPHATWIVGHRGAPAARAREHDRQPRLRRELRRRRRRIRRPPDARRRGRPLPRRGHPARHAAHPCEELHLARDREAHAALGARRVPHPAARAGLPPLRHRRCAYVVEVKTGPGTQLGTMARRVARLAREFGVAERCLVASFDAEFLKRMREADPRDRDELPLRSSRRPARAGPADADLSARRRDRPAPGPRDARRCSRRPPRRGSRCIPGRSTSRTRSAGCSPRASRRSRRTHRTRPCACATAEPPRDTGLALPTPSGRGETAPPDAGGGTRRDRSRWPESLPACSASAAGSSSCRRWSSSSA